MAGFEVCQVKFQFSAEETGISLALSETPKTGLIATQPI